MLELSHKWHRKSPVSKMKASLQKFLTRHTTAPSWDIEATNPTRKKKRSMSHNSRVSVSSVKYVILRRIAKEKTAARMNNTHNLIWSTMTPPKNPQQAPTFKAIVAYFFKIGFAGLLSSYWLGRL